MVDERPTTMTKLQSVWILVFGLGLVTLSAIGSRYGKGVFDPQISIGYLIAGLGAVLMAVPNLMTVPLLRERNDVINAAGFTLLIFGASLWVGYELSSPKVISELILFYQDIRKVAGAAAIELIVALIALIGYLLQLLKAKKLLI